MKLFHKLRKAFWERFLPEYCRQTMLERNLQLEYQVMELKRQNELLCARLDATEHAMRVLRRPACITVEGK